MLVYAIGIAATSVEQGSPLLYCSDFHPQTTLDVHQVMTDYPIIEGIMCYAMFDSFMLMQCFPLAILRHVID